MKKCFKCLRELPLSEFYRHPQMLDGHLGKCKSCAKADVRDHRLLRLADPAYVAAERKRGREKHARLYSVGANWQTPDPDATPEEKLRANNALNNAVHSGRLHKPSRCADCGRNARLDGHHTDYSKPLVVEWVCRKCHRRRHATHPERVKVSA